MQRHCVRGALVILLHNSAWDTWLGLLLRIGTVWTLYCLCREIAFETFDLLIDLGLQCTRAFGRAVGELVVAHLRRLEGEPSFQLKFTLSPRIGLEIVIVGGDAGYSDEEIEALAPRQIGTAPPEDRQPCSVCLDPITAKQLWRRLPCSHGMHAHCADPWLRTHTTCPVCVRDFRAHPSEIVRP